MNLFPPRGGWPFPGPPNCDFTINTDSPQARGLVAWWPFPGSRGQTIRDYSGKGNHGTFPGGGNDPTWVVNPFRGRILDFDGSGDHVDLGTTVYIETAVPFSISLWMYLESWTNTYPGVFSLITDDTRPLVMFLNTTDANYRPISFGTATIDGPFDTVQVTRNFSADLDGKWSHIVITYNGGGGAVGDFALYYDGASEALEASQVFGADANTPNRLGSLTSANYFEGYLDDFRIYNRELSTAEAHAIYDQKTRWELYRPMVPWTVGLAAGGGGRAQINPVRGPVYMRRPV